MMQSTEKAYGLWDSPVTPKTLASSKRFNDVQWDSDGMTLVWLERRSDGGMLVMQRREDAQRDLVDHGYSIGGRVGYGGGEFTVHGGIVYFFSDGRLYRVSLDGDMPKAITPKFGGGASPRVSADGQWVAFVHTYEHNDVLAIVDQDGTEFPIKVHQGTDFVMQPAWSPDGTQIACVVWNHPLMPWNGCELRVITLEKNQRGVPYPITNETIAGNEHIAVLQPEFSPDGNYIAYVSDATGWWQLYLYDRQAGTHRQITHELAEHGQAAWVQGTRIFEWSGDSKTITYIRTQNANYELWRYDLIIDSHTRIISVDNYTYFERLAVNPKNDSVALITSASTIPLRIIIANDLQAQVIARATPENIPQVYLPEAHHLSWQGHDGEIAYGLYYAPQNPRYHSQGLPPLIVLVHGGPTSHRMARYEEDVIFFTSRGYAVLNVNHRGSTGYGKAYMDKHQGNWGIYDVQDSITGAQSLIERGLAHSKKIVIMGGSAGGYTVLQALCDAPGFFKAGICSYGISSHFILETHKFEERYTEWLLGALPEAVDLYRERSPLYHAHKIKDAVLVFQGADDNVVPKNQSDAIVSALKRNNVPYEYHVYEGEGHGFRKPSTRIDFYNKIIAFLIQHVIYG